MGTPLSNVSLPEEDIVVSLNMLGLDHSTHCEEVPSLEYINNNPFPVSNQRSPTTGEMGTVADSV